MRLCPCPVVWSSFWLWAWCVRACINCKDGRRCKWLIVTWCRSVHCPLLSHSLHGYLLSQITGTTVKTMQAASARGSLHKMTANIYRKLARTGIPLVGQHIVVSLLDRDEDILYLEWRFSLKEPINCWNSTEQRLQSSLQTLYSVDTLKFSSSNWIKMIIQFTPQYSNLVMHQRIKSQLQQLIVSTFWSGWCWCWSRYREESTYHLTLLT